MAVQVGTVASITEIRRERETLRYEPFLYDRFTINDSGEPLPPSQLSSPADLVLTSLAQLGAYQTETDRGTVSLFDSKYQFFLAEGVCSRRVIRDGPQEHLRVQGTAIPRQHGACEHVLLTPPPLEPSKANNAAASVPVIVIPDLWEDARFRSKPNCRPCNGSARFYAAAPLRTAKGVNIGVYCVTRPTPGGAWDDGYSQHMRDTVRTIMEHLEASRFTASHRRNARLIRGMGSFIEGRSTISGWQQQPGSGAFADYTRLEGSLDATQQRFERIQQQQEFAYQQPHAPRDRSAERSPSPEAPNPAKVGSRNVNSSNGGEGGQSGKAPVVDELDPSHIISRASNIIRESFEVEGCFFFDVSLGSYQSSSTVQPSKAEQAEGSGSSSDFASSPPCSEDEQPTSPVEPEQGPQAAILGYSTTEASSINETKLKDSKAGIPKHFLSKLLKRYPNGKIFHFDAVGELQTSESSEDDTLYALRPQPLTQGEEKEKPQQQQQPGITESQRPPPTHSRTRSYHRVSRPDEGVLIHRAFPAARSVAFVPIWDSKKARWFAGTFIYTQKANRLFTVEGELSFLTAFSTLVAADLLSLEVLQADKAKSNALGSLSHELRSPLHGVILGTELLNDTDLSVFQENATHIIETCSRTLLDTLDHLLDYSKVNSLAARRRTIEATTTSRTGSFRQQRQQQQQQQPSSPRRERGAVNPFMKGRLPQPRIQVDKLAEDVVESMFAGLKFQHKSIKQMNRKHGQAELSSSSADVVANQRLDTAQAVEQLGSRLGSSKKETLASLGHVAVYLSIDPSCNWAFDSLPGGIRRIFMNVVGNALKYTHEGTVVASLTQEMVAVKRSSSRKIPMVKFKVQDTGKGIGAAFLRHELFKPFSQEDDLSPGTGLGLSIVKTITSQMRGKISVQSEVGVGTTMTVLLPLEPSRQDLSEGYDHDSDETLFVHQVRDLKGLRVRLRGLEGPAGTASSSGTAATAAQSFIKDICSGWLHMEVVRELETDKRLADVTLWSQEALPASSHGTGADFSGTANVVICHDALEAYRLSRPDQPAWKAGVFEFISQPVGPRKLARAISLAFQRWAGVPRLPQPVRPNGLPRLRSSSADAIRRRMPPATLPTDASSASDPMGYAGSTDPPSARNDSVNPVKSPVPDHDSTAPPRNGSSSCPAHTPAKPVVLLVDDNHINLKVLYTYMKKLGHEYQTAANGKLALDAYTSSPPGSIAAVIMDMSMPVMDGFEATRRIRDHEQKLGQGRTAIFALTGLASDEAYQEALQCGVDVFLTKPIKLKVLRSVLDEMNVLQADERNEVK